MRLRDVVIGTTLMSFALTTVNGGSFSGLLAGKDRDANVAPKAKVEAPTAALPLIAKDRVLRTAYYDTVSILTSNNACSDFFGGPGVVDIFDQLISKARKEHFPRNIGMQLSGSTINVFNSDSKKAYRVFERMSINTNGPFYRRKFSNWELSMSPVGRFEPNTREARVLMLLHELGHAVRGDDGDWLLPDDGRDAELSKSNTSKIERVCKDQIRDLGKAESLANTATARKMIGENKE